MPNVYGNSGNRWWVGLNVGETGGQSTIFGTPSLNPFTTPSGYESLPSGDAADDAKFAAAAIADKITPVTISVENIEWYNITGPYPTQAAANAAIPAIQKAHPAPGSVQQVERNNASNPAGAAAGAVAGAASDAASVGTFLSHLSSRNLWLRAGKVIAGLVLVIVGVMQLTHAQNLITAAAKGAVLA